MILRVDLEQFLDELRFQEILSICYISVQNKYTCVQAVDSKKGNIIQALTSRDINDVKHWLQSQNITVREGSWVDHNQEIENHSFSKNLYVAAIAYFSNESKPGLWINAYEEEPSPAEVLKKIYDEFKEDGEIPETHFEEFLRLACPNVLILSQAQLSQLHHL